MMHGKSNDSGSGPVTFTDVLQLRVSQSPDQVAFVYEDEMGQVRQWTYRDLDDRSRAVSAWLVQHSGVGDRALLVYPPGLDFIAAFCGCLHAGVLPVPATYPKPRRPLPRLDAIAEDCQPQLVLTHSSALEGLCLDQQSLGTAHIPWQATDQLETATQSERQHLPSDTNDLAFLQYTSGSTSEPRGVMISHGNLLDNLESIRVGFDIPAAGEGDQVPFAVFWLPAYHDMGLVGGILTPIYVGGTCYLLAPTTFLRKPLRWLELLSETGAQFSGAPNFGYEIAVQKTTPEDRAALRLENWRLAFCGAEPINPTSLGNFAEAFAESGFRPTSYYPCYGMAEVTLLVTGGIGPSEPRVLYVDRSELRKHRVAVVAEGEPNAHPLVGCGCSPTGQTVNIVDPQTQTLRAEGQVGEIWVQGPAVARGYWNRTEINAELFEAKIQSGPDGSYLRTGDLGFFWDGELYVTGRLKDVIIIRGRNHYPQDIETTATHAHPAVDMGAAFSTAGDRQEMLIVVHQLHREHRNANLEEVLTAIRTAIVDQHELDPHAIVLIRPVSLPITSSGKVQRNRCREQYLAGELKIAAEWSLPSTKNHEAQQACGSTAPLEFLENLSHAEPAELTAEVQQWLLSWLTTRANLNSGVMQPSTPFAELGIDSLTAVEISQEMDGILGLQLPPMVIWSCPTPEALSVYLAEQLLTEQLSSATRNGAASADAPNSSSSV